MLGCYFLFSKRSAFFPDSEPDYSVRRLTGYIIVFWSFSFLSTLLVPLFGRGDLVDHIIVTFDLGALSSLPLIQLLLCRIMQYPRIAKRYILLQAVVPVCATVFYAFFPIVIVAYGIVAYWVIHAFVVIMHFYRKERKYRKRMRDLYSDPVNHDVQWVERLLLIVAIYMCVFFAVYYYASYAIADISYLFFVGLVFYFAANVDRHSRNVEVWPDTHHAELHKADAAEKTAGTRDLNWIGERLSEKFEKDKLYLNHEMNIDTLSAIIGTNRTYVSKYLASQQSTYYDYINQLRIIHAKQLIDSAEDELNLSDVAYQSGFRSDSTFRRAFLEFEKCTPSDYLRLKAGQ